MTRYERKIYSFGVVIAAILIIAIVAVLTEGCGAETAVYAAPMVSVEDFTEVATEAPKKAEIRDHNANQRSQRVETLEETDEQEASKEAPAETTGESRMDGDAADQADAADSEGARSDSGPEEMASETSVPIYRIAGDLIPEEIQRALYEALEANGIEYWYEGALCQMFQESHGQVYAENPNGLDKGLYQFRISYWDWSTGDIFDVDAQLSRYASEMAARFNAGLSTNEAISRHKTSDYCTSVDWLYVEHVRQWLPLMEAIR